MHTIARIRRVSEHYMGVQMVSLPFPHKKGVRVCSNPHSTSPFVAESCRANHPSTPSSLPNSGMAFSVISWQHKGYLSLRWSQGKKSVENRGTFTRLDESEAHPRLLCAALSTDARIQYPIHRKNFGTPMLSLGLLVSCLYVYGV